MNKSLSILALSGTLALGAFVGVQAGEGAALRNANQAAASAPVSAAPSSSGTLQTTALQTAPATRTYDAGADGAELIESFPAAFAKSGSTGLQRLRGTYNAAMYAAYSSVYMLPTTRLRYRMPSPVPGMLVIVLRLPVVIVVETTRRLSPRFRRLHEKWMCRHRENWHDWQTSGRPAEYAHGKGLRR